MPSALLGFVAMLVLWKDGIPYWKVALGYALVGIGVGLAGTPASHSLTGAVPVKRAGMGSLTSQLAPRLREHELLAAASEEDSLES